MKTKTKSVLVNDSPYARMDFIEQPPWNSKRPFRCKLTRYDESTEEVLLTGEEVLALFRKRGVQAAQ